MHSTPFEAQVDLPISYRGRQFDCGYRMDLLVGGLVVVELKAVAQIDSVHDAQLMTYLRLSKSWLGMLINFNVAVLKNGVRRRVLDCKLFS